MNSPTPNPHTPDLIDDLDKQIDRTLSGLSKTEPGSGFNDRLLRAIEQRRIDGVLPSKARLSGRPSLLGGWRRYGFAAAALAACTFIPLISHRLQPPNSALGPKPNMQASETLTTEAAPPSNGSAANPRNSLPALPSPPAVESLSHPPSVVLSSHSPASLTLATASLQISLTAPTDLDQQALEDLHAPSHPAPPVPLTTQERLTRLMLRRGERQDLAQLDSSRALSFAQQERASFQNFFEPPLPPELAIAVKVLSSDPTAATPSPSTGGAVAPPQPASPISTKGNPE